MFAQQDFGPEWGKNATPEERRQNVLTFNLYKDAYDSHRYDDALNCLPQLIANSPEGSEDIYIYAINIYGNKLQHSTGRGDRDIYIDAIMALYDLRLKYFGGSTRT